MDAQGLITKDNQKPIDSHEVRDAFFEFILSFMKDYNKCFVLFVSNKYKYPKNKVKPNGSFTEIFNLKEFQNSHNATKEETFVFKFCETRFLSYFIQERYKMSPNESYY